MPNEDMDRIAELLDRAMNLKRVDRKQFLEKECSGHHGLLNQIKELVEAAERGRSFLEDLDHDDPSDYENLDPVEVDPDITTEKTILGDFRIQKKIGSGGMGTVYEAEQISLKRLVALKVLPSCFSISERSVKRFLREGEACGRQSHPGIVSVYAVGEDRGNYFIAQELVNDGFTLARKIVGLEAGGDFHRGHFRKVAKIFAEIASALQHAHDSGVIHRDVKPSNILLTEDGRPKLTDFGLAKFEESPGVSRSGDPVAGTPSYMSPEQVKSRRGQINHRTDIFSLGVTLYETLTLKRPFEGKTHEILSKIVTIDPIEPKRVDPRVPVDLSTICLKCMEKQPERRYSSMRELAEDLQRFLSGDVILATPISLRGRVWKRIKSNPVVSVSAGVALVALFALTIVLPWIIAGQKEAARIQIGLERDIAVAAQKNADDQREVAENERDKAISAQAEADHQRNLAEERGARMKKMATHFFTRFAAQRGDWNTVLEYSNKAIQEDEENVATIRLGKIEALVELDQCHLALAELEKLEKEKEAENHRGEILLWRAATERNWSDHTRTKRMLEEALSAGLESDDELYASGLLAETSPEAIDFFRQCLSVNPFHLQARKMLVVSLILLGRQDEAREGLSLWCALYPECPSPRILKAVLFALNHDLSSVEAELSRCEKQLTSSDIENLRSLFQLLDELFRLGENLDLAGTAEQTKTIKRILPKFFETWSRISTHEINHNSDVSHGTSIDLFPFCLPTYMVNVVSGFLRVITLSHLRADKLALAELDKLIETNPEGTVYFFRGVLLVHLDRMEEAEESFRFAAAIPSLLDVKRGALHLAMRSQWTLSGSRESSHKKEMLMRSMESCKRLARLGKLRPDQAKNAIELAIRLEEFDLCRTIIAEWEHQYPDDLDACRCRVKVEYFSGSYGPALIAANGLFSRSPKDPTAVEYWERSSKLLGKIGPPDKALKIEDYIVSHSQN